MLPGDVVLTPSWSWHEHRDESREPTIWLDVLDVPLILFLGATAVLSMPTDIFPEIDIPVVTIIWQYTGLSTPEMEQRVTTYSEYALSSSVNGIRDTESLALPDTLDRSYMIWKAGKGAPPAELKFLS